MNDDRMPHDGGIIERLIAENETLRKRLVECQAAVLRWASRAEQAETQLAAVQPPVVERPNNPDMTPVAQRKLSGLLAEGWAISGYSIIRHTASSEMRHGFVTTGGLVGWWQQPGPTQADQPPVAWICTEWSGSGMPVLTFDGPPADPGPRDQLTKPVWTPLYTNPK